MQEQSNRTILNPVSFPLSDDIAGLVSIWPKIRSNIENIAIMMAAARITKGRYLK